MARFFYLDANALAKHYVPEKGTSVVNHLFTQVTRDNMMCLTLGTLEVISIFVRKKNANLLSLTTFNQAMADFEGEVIKDLTFTKISGTDQLVDAATPFVEKHSLNATDAVIPRSALDFAGHLRVSGDDLVLVTSDHRLLRAARAEGLLIFNPETQTEAELDVLLLT